MTVFTIFNEWDEAQQWEALNFGADPNLRNLLFQRLREIEKEIGELEPGKTDPVDYIRNAHDLHARKQEIMDLMNLVQEIRNKAAALQQPQQQEVS